MVAAAICTEAAVKILDFFFILSDYHKTSNKLNAK